MTDSPFEPPPMGGEIPVFETTGEAPRVWTWYVLYCVAMACLYFACLIGGVLLFVYAESIATDRAEGLMVGFQGIMLAVVGGVFFALFLTALLLPRRKASWYMGFITIGLGLTSACCLPAAIPLLIFWLKEDNKRYMGVLRKRD